MAPDLFDDNAHYLQYVKLLRELHAHMSQGRGNDPVADTARDQMDMPWRHLSEAEVERVRGLSADLYSLEIDLEPLVATPTDTDRELMRQLTKARENGKWDLTLHLLRATSRFFQLSLVSYLRAGIWRELHDHETAILFYEHAIRLAPDNANYQCILMDQLVRAGHEERASRMAEEAISAVAHPNVIMRAADVLFNATRMMPPDRAVAEYRRLVPILSDALSRASSLDAKDREKSIEIAAMVELGMCHEHLGNYPMAIVQYNNVLSIQPNHDAALVARGILNYGVQTEQAIRDFQNAIDENTLLVWPFFYLAHQAILRGDFDSCIDIVRHALERQCTSAVHADLLEWLAISGSMTGMADADVTAYFEKAIGLSPANDRIRRNFKEYNKWKRQSEEAYSTHWKYASETDARKLGLARPAA